MIKAKLLGATAAAESLAIEDVFSTYLYTGNGPTQTITNGIDLAGEGGLVWLKARSLAYDHFLYDTNRGATKVLRSNLTNAEATLSGVTSFNSNGFSLGPVYNDSAATFASWTFRKAPRFFDVVTWTGNDVAGRTIAHDLGVEPGCIIVKATSAADNWQVYHRSNTAAPATDYLMLNSTAFTADSNTRWNDTLPTSTVFSLGTDSSVNTTGRTYVAYLFAHDPLGPSGDGSDGLIACGSYQGNGSTTGPVINLGWEPQWLLVKRFDGLGDWNLLDNMRGFVVGGTDAELNPNGSDAEQPTETFVSPTATGFQLNTTNAGYNASASGYIYIAIRRGPMREPTVGTQVFGLSARTGTGANATVTGGQTADAFLVKNRGSAVASLFSSRMTGTGYLVTSSIAAEVAAGTTILQANPWDVMDGVKVGTSSTITNASGNTFINYLFRRAPGFFDVVAYTGDGATGRSLPHNLGVAPELMIFKRRDSTFSWAVSVPSLGANPSLLLNSTLAAFSSEIYTSAQSATTITLTNESKSNASGNTFIAYLFATLPGISKVGSYTGNGSSQTINCGFTTGARFILIKRTDSTGDWYVWDTARGIVSGNDPHLSLNTTAAEVTTDDTIDPDNSGFIVNQVAATNVNVNAATYIFFAVS